MTKEIKPDTYIGREFDEHGSKDIYIDNNGIYYTIPVMSLTEIRRLSNLELNKQGEKQ